MSEKTVTTEELRHELEKYKEKAEVYGRMAAMYRRMIEKLIEDMDEAKKMLEQRGSYDGRI